MLIAAAVLTLLIVIVHSVLGERYILTRLFRRDNLPKLLGRDVFTKRTLRLAWHVTSAMGLGFAALLVAMASPGAVDERTIAMIIAASFAACGVIAFVISRGVHLSWIVFFAIAALAWIAR